MEYTITYGKIMGSTRKKLQVESIYDALTLAKELVDLGYTIFRISRTV